MTTTDPYDDLSALPPAPLGYLFEPWYQPVGPARTSAVIYAYKILERTLTRLVIGRFSTARFDGGRWYPGFDDALLATQPPIVLEPPAVVDSPILCPDIGNRLFFSLEHARRDLYREMEGLPSGRDVYEEAVADDQYTEDDGNAAVSE